MYGFGDCRRPLAETAALVEEIVYRQMVEILYHAEDIGRQRSVRFLGIEEFIFLLRRDKKKLKRLLQYLEFRDLKTAVAKGVAIDDEDTVETDSRHTTKKRRKICYDFISTIDQTGELLALFEDTTDDEVQFQRKMRAELLSRNLDMQQYLEFCEARQASFTPRYKTQKFKDWLLSGVTLDIKPSPLAIEVLSYLAYETVAQIVDFALIVKQDMSVTVDDPLRHHMAPQCTNLDMFTASSASSMLQMSQNSAVASSPSTPSSFIDSSGSSAAARLKSKKRKMLGAHLSRELVTANAITPTEVREALRRYLQPTGPFASFSKEPLLPLMHRLVAC